MCVDVCITDNREYLEYTKKTFRTKKQMLVFTEAQECKRGMDDDRPTDTQPNKVDDCNDAE